MTRTIKPLPKPSAPIDTALHPLHGWRFTVPRNQSRNQFFPANVGNRKTVGFLRFDPMAPPYLAAEPTIKLPAVSVYGINAGSVNGTNIGYLFWSPLVCKIDPFFALFRRPQFDAVSIVREGTEGTNKYQLRGGLSIFTVADDAVLVTFHTTSKITEALEL